MSEQGNPGGKIVAEALRDDVFNKQPVASPAAVKSIVMTFQDALAFVVTGLLCALLITPGASAFADDASPVLLSGTVTDLNLAAGEIAEFFLPVAAGTTYTLDLASAGPAAVQVTDPEGETVGRFQAAYGMTFTASEESIYKLSVSGNGHDPLDARLAAYSGALPFYRPAPEEELPDFMTNPWYEGAEFGYVYVPADRSPGNRHSYRLTIIQMPGGPEATNGPLVYLSGGPGVSAFGTAFLNAPLTDTCPVIAVNQRGAYLSQPDLFPVSPEETTLELQARLGGPGGIDFNTINTRQNAADILDVMTALGHHEPFNLWGTSYGTMLAQEVIRQAPERIRAAVLDGVVTMDQPQWTIIAQTFVDALNALFDDVAQHPEASLLYPDFGEQFFAFAADLDPEDHGEFFENLVFRAMNFSRWGSIENLPGIIWRAERGETAALDELVALKLPDSLPPNGGPISPNMYCAVLRQDFLPFESMETAAALTDSIPFPLNMHGFEYSLTQFELSEDWDFLDQAPESFRQRVTEDVPVLILNGTYDTQTGLSGARHVAEHLPNAYYVELPAIGHAVLFGGEAVYQVARDFLNDPSQAPDITEVSSLSLDFPPPWPADAPHLGVEKSVSIAFEEGGRAAWHRFTGQSGIVYDIELDGAALYVADDQARILFSSDNSARWTAGHDAEVYLMLVAETSGTYGLRLARVENVMEVPEGYDPAVAATWPMLYENMTFRAIDENRNYNWEVLHWDGETVYAQLTGASTFVVDHEALFAHSGAGVYTVRLTDQDNADLAAATIKVRIPMRFVADQFDADEGTYRSTQGIDTFRMLGGPVDVNAYYYDVLNARTGDPVTEEECGALVGQSPAGETNIFAFTNPIESVVSVRVRVFLDPASNNEDVARLIAAELDEVWSGLFTVIPVMNLAGTVLDEADGETPVIGATVTATHNVGLADTTDANGAFVIQNFENTGAAYSFYIQKVGFVAKTVTIADILAGPVLLEALADGSDLIAGTITSDPAAPRPGKVSVRARTTEGNYVADSTGAPIEVLTNPADGVSYVFPLPTAVLDEGPFDLEFRRPGFIFNDAFGLGVLRNVQAGRVDADIDLLPVTLISVDGAGNAQAGADGEVLVTIRAIPAFEGAPGEVDVAYGNDTPINNVVFDGADAYTFVHPAYENFSVIVRADTSRTPRDAGDGYFREKRWDYVKSTTAPVMTLVDRPSILGGSASSGDTVVRLLPGGLKGPVRDMISIAIARASAAEAEANLVTGSDIVEVVMHDENGDPITSSDDIDRIWITVKFDPAVVAEGAFEDFLFLVFQADSIADLAAGTAVALYWDDSWVIDYTRGFVTFWVDHLSAFGVGPAPAEPVPGVSGSGGCFINTLRGEQQ